MYHSEIILVNRQQTKHEQENRTMKIELSFVELSEIESALREKVERVNNVVNECDDPDMAKELLTYQHNLNNLYAKIEAELYGFNKFSRNVESGVEDK